jgi:hypothetical protein
MNAISLNNLWSYLQGLSLTASNQRWLGERLLEASTSRSTTTEEEIKLKKLNALFGVWSGEDGERIEKAIQKAHTSDYERELVSFDD